MHALMSTPGSASRILSALCRTRSSERKQVPMVRTSPAVRIAAFTCVFLFSVISFAQNSQGTIKESANAARMRKLNALILDVQSELGNATPDRAAALRKQAATVLAERAATLQTLIISDPQGVLKLAFAGGLLQDLAARFPDSVKYLETHVTLRGPVEYVIYDEKGGESRSSIHLNAGGRKLEVHFASHEPPGLKSGDLLEVSGVQSGLLIAGSDGSVYGSTLTTASCGTTGVQNIAVMLVTFPGVTPPAALTPAAAHDMFFDPNGPSLNGFWQEASYGQTSASGDVFGWYTLDRSYTCSEMDAARDTAIARAVAEGADFQKYNRIFVLYPNVASCVTGFAQVGCTSLNTPSGTITASSSYLDAIYSSDLMNGVSLATHEGGHNLGLLHSGTLSYGSEVLGPLSSTGTVAEFGDYWSTMGSQTLGQYPAPQKAEVLNWLASGTNYVVVQSSGSWTLQPLEVSPASLQALKIQRGTGSSSWLWVEFRQPLGKYDSTLMTDAFSGALIHYEDLSTGPSTRLLDFTPDGSWNTWWYTALAAGKTWADPYSNLSISVASATPSGLTVNVSYGASLCTVAQPTVALTPQDPTTHPGSSVAYNVSVTNNDSAECAPSTIYLDSKNPIGWSTGYSAPSLSLSPGQSGIVVMSKTAPPDVPVGTYPVDAQAVSNSTSGLANASVTVIAETTLSVNLSVSASTYSVGQTVSIIARVLDGSNPAGRASVTFRLTKPGGSQAMKTVTADSKLGLATWSYKIGRRDPSGVYSVTATATYGSQIATSNVVNFTVQ